MERKIGDSTTAKRGSLIQKRSRSITGEKTEDRVRIINQVPLDRRQNKGVGMGFQGGSGGYDRRPREMHKAVCAECKKECEVPFKPSGDRPIYCKECYSKKKDSGR
ncbi:MAG: CxxC-x17-CxxC domain-containing protein [Candidatus Omnitrophota bacterium]